MLFGKMKAKRVFEKKVTIYVPGTVAFVSANKISTEGGQV
jgi:hypothetical protein